MKVLLVAINSKYIHTALGIRSVAAFCKKKGIQNISFLEETIQTPILAVLAEITKSNPDIVGVDLHIWNKRYVEELAKLVKQVLPEVKIIAGGPEASFTPRATFMECNAFDYIVQGEGEETFYCLVKNIEKAILPPNHVSYKNAVDEIIVSTPGIVEDLKVLPFPYENVSEVVEKHKIIYYETTRGCPFSCAYCLSGISKSLRRKPLSIVLDELKILIEAKVPLVKFVDRTYNLDEEYYLPIMEFLARCETNTTFHFEIKADILSESVVDFFKTVPKGRFQFEIGVQTTNLLTLKAINRQDDFNLLSYNVKKILSYKNIHVHLDLIAGLPYEGLESFKKSFNDVYVLKPNMLQLGFLKVLKGSEMYYSAEKHSMKYMEEAPYEVLATKYLSYSEMRFLKVLEDVFDHTYNTNKFLYSLEFIITKVFMGDAFEFFGELTKWWEQKKLYPLGHNSKEVALLLLKFVEENFKDCSKEFKEVIKFDVFISQPNYRPTQLGWCKEEIKEEELAFWRRLDDVHKYLPEYDFSTWRQIRKYLPIEKFLWVPNGEFGEVRYILSDYTQKEPSFIKIDSKDFLGEDI